MNSSRCNNSNRNNTRDGKPFGDFQIDIENIFDHFFGDRVSAATAAAAAAASGRGWYPRADVTESDMQYEVTLELPGMSADEVKLEMKDGSLEVSGEKKLAEPTEGTSRIKAERPSGEFRRLFEFSTQIEPDQISAEFKQGILRIVLPKSEKVLPRKIEIKVSE